MLVETMRRITPCSIAFPADSASWGNRSSAPQPCSGLDKQRHDSSHGYCSFGGKAYDFALRDRFRSSAEKYPGESPESQKFCGKAVTPDCHSDAPLAHLSIGAAKGTGTLPHSRREGTMDC